MIRKLKENKAMAAVISVLLLAVANAIQQRFDVGSKDNAARSRRSELWRKVADQELAIESISNRLYKLEPKKRKQ